MISNAWCQIKWPTTELYNCLKLAYLYKSFNHISNICHKQSTPQLNVECWYPSKYLIHKKAGPCSSPAAVSSFVSPNKLSLLHGSRWAPALVWPDTTPSPPSAQTDKMFKLSTFYQPIAADLWIFNLFLSPTLVQRIITSPNAILFSRY